MARRIRKPHIWLGIGLVALFVVGWVVLFARPTLPIPRFLSQAHVVKSEMSYYEGMRTVVRDDQAKEIPETTVTEKLILKPSGSFSEILERAQNELTASRGWDLGALPQEKVARFYQRTTNTSISLFLTNGQVQVAMSQTRYATPNDRLRHWLSKSSG